MAYFPETLLTEAGVSYYRDNPENENKKGYFRAKYWSRAPGRSTWHLQEDLRIEGRTVQNAVDNLQRLCDHWSRQGWKFAPFKKIK